MVASVPKPTARNQPGDFAWHAGALLVRAAHRAHRRAIDDVACEAYTAADRERALFHVRMHCADPYRQPLRSHRPSDGSRCILRDDLSYGCVTDWPSLPLVPYGFLQR